MPGFRHFVGWIGGIAATFYLIHLKSVADGTPGVPNTAPCIAGGVVGVLLAEATREKRKRRS